MPESQNSPEGIGTIKTVGVLLFNPDRSKVLLVKHTSEAQNKAGVYGFPAGKVDIGKSPKEAALEELVQETGLVSKEENLSPFEENYFSGYLPRHKQGVSRHMNMTVYVCDKFEGQLKKSEKTIPEWVDVNDLKNRELMPNVLRAINRYRGVEEDEQ